MHISEESESEEKENAPEQEEMVENEINNKEEASD